jgi:hypothetical protein
VTLGHSAKPQLASVDFSAILCTMRASREFFAYAGTIQIGEQIVGLFLVHCRRIDDERLQRETDEIITQLHFNKALGLQTALDSIGPGHSMSPHCFRELSEAEARSRRAPLLA